MYGKLVNGALITAPEKILGYEINGKHCIICNPQKRHYAEAGYKVVEYGEIPEAEDGQEVFVSYEETEDRIVVKHIIGGV